MSVSKPPIQWIGAHPFNFSEGHGGYFWEGIVLHIMAGTLAGTDAWFNDPHARASTHFGIGRNGAIHQYVDLNDTAYAHGIVETGYTSVVVKANEEINPDSSPNWYLIGIEHEGQSGDGMTNAMFDSSTHLSAWLFQDVILPMQSVTAATVDRDHVIGHYEISPKSRPNCPGFTSTLFQTYIARVQTMLSAGPVPPPTVDYKAMYEQVQAQYVALRDASTVTVAGMRDNAARLNIQANNLEKYIV